MAPAKSDPTGALVSVVKALENLTEEDRQWVLQSAASRWNVNQLRLAANAGSLAVMPGNASLNILTGGNAGDVQAAIAKKDVRTFIRLKRPNTDVQRVACLGYYLIQTSSQPGFSSKDISTAHTDSGGSKINMTRALDNATRQSKYLSSRGPKEKQLTTLGEDIVLALPDQEAVKNVEATAKKKGKKRAKRKSIKKA